MKPIALQVSWPKTKVQVLLGETVQFIHACGEDDIDIFESLPYLGSVVHNASGSRWFRDRWVS